MEVPADLIDQIYEAAAVPELWPAVLLQLCGIAGAHAGALTSMDASGLAGYLATDTYEAAYRDYWEHGSAIDNVRLGRSLRDYPMAFSSDLELCSEVELAADPLYTRFLRPHGLEWTAGTVIPVPSGDMLVFDLATRAGVGPFRREALTRLDHFRPHLARAALLSHRLGRRAAASQAAAMQLVGLPCAVWGRGGRLLAANALFEALAPRVQFAAFGHLAFADPDVDRLVEAAMASFGTAAEPVVRSVPMRAVPDAPALVVHLLPVRRAGGDIFLAAEGVIVVTPVAAPAAPLTQVLMGLFDLTPAEAKVARGIASGLDVQRLAAALALSPETVRSQLKAVLAKTGTRRQAELGLMLSGARPLPGPQ
jgi:DNA-binding CsgD family transcriptional regulator